MVKGKMFRLLGHCKRVSSMPVIRVCAKDLRKRQAARVLVLNEENKVLLFEYRHTSTTKDALTGKGSYFTTPGGQCDPGESFLECAKRELFEETGISVPVDPRVLATRTAPILTSSGEVMLADEQYFCVKVEHPCISECNWTEEEKHCIHGFSWYSTEDLKQFNGFQLWPKALGDIVDAANIDKPALKYASTLETIGDVSVELEY